MQIETKELARAGEAILVEMLVVLYKLKFPHKAKMETVASDCFGVSAPTLRDAIAGKTYVGIENLLRAESVCETDIVSRFFKAKGGGL
jgi:hypothetical protein